MTTAEQLDNALTERNIEPTEREFTALKLDASLAILRAIMKQQVHPEYLKGISLAIDMLEDVRRATESEGAA